MSRGKYSPTVSAAYVRDRSWWTKYAHAGVTGDEFVQYDPEGYDSYGYDRDDVDRAGNAELEYLRNDAQGSGLDAGYDFNFLYDDAIGHWGFDGVKPVRKA
jgi:hypothetical protein